MVPKGIVFLLLAVHRREPIPRVLVGRRQLPFLVVVHRQGAFDRRQSYANDIDLQDILSLIALSDKRELQLKPNIVGLVLHFREGGQDEGCFEKGSRIGAASGPQCLG